MICSKMRPFEWNHTPALFYDSASVVCCFLPKCAFFYQWCLSCFFITTLCFYDFCKTVLVKKYTPCQGMSWFSPTKCHNCYTGFMWYFNYTIKAHWASGQHKKRLEGAALELPPGLTRPGPCEPEFWKNDLPANLFFAACTPPKCKKVTPAF